MSALALLAETARDNHSDLVRLDGNVAIFAVQPVNASGAPPTRFLIKVTDTGDKIVAKESKTEHLPAFCPERHINLDGTFCLYWAEVEPHEITNTEAARRWWRKLLIFLLRQRTAGALRSWPGKGDARAHGPEAARFQAAAEAAVQVAVQARIANRKFKTFNAAGRLVLASFVCMAAPPVVWAIQVVWDAGRNWVSALH